MIRYFAKHPTAANLLMLLIVVLGLSAAPSLRRETFPDFTASNVEVRVVYPGATADKVEQAICLRLEDALDGVRFVKELRAEAREGVGIVVAEMEEGADLASFKDEVSSKVDGINTFPDDAEDPVITELGTTDQVLVLLVSGPMQAKDLKAHCEDLKDRLQALPEVSLVDVDGFSTHQLRIELSAIALQAYGLDVATVAQLIAQQNVDMPAGGIETLERDLLVRFVAQRTTVRELEELVLLAGSGGAEIRVRDLGRVVDRFELDEERIELAGRRAGQLVIKKNKTQDITTVARAVKAFVARERIEQPQVELQISQDGSTLVNERLQLLLTNGWQGMLLVFACMWLFFNLRLSVWVAASLPVSFLGALYFMPWFGLTINMMTMVGMLLALGLLMDDGIVIAENVATHRARGKSGMRAAIDGVTEVAPGVLASFTTTLCVLGPLMFIEGNIGKVLKVVPMVLILVMAVSLVEAFMILPAHLGHSLQHVDPNAQGRFRARFDGWIEALRERVLGRTVDTLLRWRYPWLGCVLGAFLISLAVIAGGALKFQAFPDLDGDVVVGRVLFPQGTPLARTQAVVAKMTSALNKVDATHTPQQPQQQSLVQATTVRFNTNSEAFEQGPHVATVTVDLLGAETRTLRIQDVLDAWRAELGEVPDVLSLTLGEQGSGPAGRAIEVQFRGAELAELKAAAVKATAFFARYVGVSNLADDLRPGKPEVRLRLREGAVGEGLSSEAIARQLRGAFHGATADEVQVGSESYDVDVRLAAEDQDSLGDLQRLHLSLPSGRQAAIGAYTESVLGRGWARIARVDRQRTVSVRGDVDAGLANTNELIAAFKKELVPQLTAEHGVEVRFEGEVAEGGTTQASMMRSLLFGLIGVFLLLSLQFRSYVEPLIVLIAIPLALMGVIWGHLLLGLELSMPSTLGFISLTGVVVNDSILLVLFLKLQRKAGAGVLESAGQASRQRFRAIVLTSLTTVAGLTPLLFERSAQAQVLIPLAASIASGMIASTVLILLVVPSLYAVLGDFGLLASVHDDDPDAEDDAPGDAPPPGSPQPSAPEPEASAPPRVAGQAEPDPAPVEPPASSEGTAAADGLESEAPGESPPNADGA